MVFYFCNNSVEKNKIFLSSFDKYLLSLNKKFQKEFIFSPIMSNLNTFPFNHSYLLSESDTFYLIDYLFFIEPIKDKCRFCSFGYNKETDSIIFKTLERFKKENISLSPFEYEHLLKNNLLTNIDGFDLLFDNELNSWYFHSDKKKVLVRNPSLPSHNQILNHLKYSSEIPFDIIESISILLADNLDIFDYCQHCNNKNSNEDYKLYLKLTYFDVTKSSCKNIFLTDIDFENFNNIYLFLHKKRTT